MGANNVAAVERGRRNDQAVADVLVHRPATLQELADAAGIGRTSVRKYVLPRLRRRGLDVREVMRSGGRGQTCIVHYGLCLPPGRVCAHEGCGTILRRANPSDRCELHGGGYLDFTEE